MMISHHVLAAVAAERTNTLLAEADAARLARQARQARQPNRAVVAAHRRIAGWATRTVRAVGVPGSTTDRGAKPLVEVVATPAE
ncbi:MAG: hypothetical protein ACR2KJ_08195 [Jatrophihabitans sp.]